MKQQTSCECSCCQSAPLKRPRYFPRQLITPAEMNLEQAYFQYYIAREVVFDRGPNDTVKRDSTRLLNALAVNLTGAQRARAEAKANGWVEMNIRKVEIARTFRTAAPGFAPTVQNHSLCGQPL